MHYAVLLEKDEDTWLGTVGNFPEVNFVGDTKQEALAQAPAAIETAIQGRIGDRRPIPAPVDERDAYFTPLVRVPLQSQLKAHLHNQMLLAGWNKQRMADALSVHRPQVDRLLDVRHNSHLPQLEAALKALGKQLVFTLSDAE